jgi:membrane fusion protein, heavy metal efflux system
VQVGDTVQLRVSAFPERVFAGRVTYISDQLEAMTGTAKVRCEVTNPDVALRVNMFATATIISPQGRDAVLVPSSAVQEINGQSVVFIPAWPIRLARRSYWSDRKRSDPDHQWTGGRHADRCGRKLLAQGSADAVDHPR